MIEIINHSLDPAFNIAVEEYLLTNITSGDIFMLWRSSPSVIIGKFQNFYEEVSPIEIEKSGVSVVRRNSGGGTVYHDTGNVNFTVITDRTEGELSYERFLWPVIAFLRTIGVSAQIDSTNAITVAGMKISGNAESVVGGRVMHHGTLLFDAELSALSALTGRAREKIKSKSIKSNPSPVTNIKEHICAQMSVEEFIASLSAHLGNAGGAHEKRALTTEEISKIEQIADEKYRTWEWTYGKCPAFTLCGKNFELQSKNGVILAVKSDDSTIEKAMAVLIGCRITKEDIISALTEDGTLDSAAISDIVLEILG